MFLSLLHSELYLGLRSASARVAVLGPALLAACQLLLAKLRDGAEQAGEALGGGFDDFNEGLNEGAYGHFVDAATLGLVLLSLLLVGLAAYSVSNERENGSLRHVLIRRGNRVATLLARYVYLLGLALLALACLLLSSYLLSGLLFEYGPVTEEGFVLIAEDEIRQEIRLGLGLALLPLPAAIAFGLLVGVISQSASQALALGLGLTVALDLFKSSIGDWSLYLYARYLPSINDQSYLADVARLVRGYSDVLVDPQSLSMNQLVPLPSLATFLLIACLVMQRRSV
jgi:ABC-type transport system involved in multi-copper enzyme maturation permease subunit